MEYEVASLIYILKQCIIWTFKLLYMYIRFTLVIVTLVFLKLEYDLFRASQIYTVENKIVTIIYIVMVQNNTIFNFVLKHTHKNTYDQNKTITMTMHLTSAKQV